MLLKHDDSYPDEFFRGLTANDSITNEGYITAAAFSFPQKSARDDHYCELSVNWNDDDGSLVNLSTKHKKGDENRQFKVGYCIVNRKLMEQLLKIYIIDNKFKYERKPVYANEDNDFQENKYHGNLLLQEDIDGSIKKNIQHTLATLAQISHDWDDDKDGINPAVSENNN